MAPLEAYLLSVLGNLLPVLPLLSLLENLEKSLRRFSFADRFFDWLFERTRRRAQGDLQRYGTVGLALFVSIPLPVTGAWTGCVAAYLFGIRRRNAFLAIGLGVCLAGGIVLVTFYGLLNGL
jgi:uncharacterized membrane protein